MNKPEVIILDKDHSELVFIACDFCEHILEEHKTCKAFPEGIPDDILKGNNNHKTPFKDQKNNIIFELK